MKKTILSFAILLSLAGSLSSCLVNRDGRGRHPDRGRDHRDDHRDDHHYDRYNN